MKEKHSTKKKIPLPKRAKKIILAVIVSVGLILGSTTVLFSVIKRKTETVLLENQSEIKTLLNEKLGFPTEYKSIDTFWTGLTLRLRLNDLVVFDKSTNIPFLSMQNLELRANILEVLLNPKFPFKTVWIQNLKLILGTTANGNFGLLGLKKEVLGSSPETGNIFASFSGLENIVLEDAELIWVKNELEIKQFLSGEFKWNTIARDGFIFSGEQQWQFQGKEKLPEMDFEIVTLLAEKNLKFSFDINGSRLIGVFNWENPIQPQLSINGKLRNFEFADLHNNLDLQGYGPAWVDWVLNSIESGLLKKADFELKGPLDKLALIGEVQFKHLNLKYDPAWPRIEDSAGTVTIEPDAVRVLMTEGDQSGAAIEKVTGLIGPLQTSGSAHVKVDAEVQGRLEDALKFLQTSPLKDSVATKLSPLNPFGPYALKLNLDIPLDNTKTKVQGEVQTQDANLMISALDLPVSNLNGLFNFTDAGVNAREVRATIYGKPFVSNLSPEVITTEGEVSAELLQKHFTVPWLKFLKGETHLQASLSKEDIWTITSDLKGMELNFPVPLSKTKEILQPMVFTIEPYAKGERRFALEAQNLLSAKWITREQDQDNLFKSGQIVFGETAQTEWPSNPGLDISGTFAELDLDKWLAFLKKEKTDLNSIPYRIKLKLGKLIALTRVFSDIDLNLQGTRSDTLIGVQTSWIQGNLVLPKNTTKAWVIDLDHLVLEKNENFQGYYDDFLQITDKPAIEFNCRNLKYGALILGSLSFQLVPQPSGYNIENMLARTNSYALAASGYWNIEGEPATSLTGDLNSRNIGKTFTEWGFNSTIKDATGQIHFNLKWPTSPLGITLNNTEGNASLRLRSGRIVGVDPGLGRILNLLSLESISKTLQLDFRNFKKGLSFDSMTSEIRFHRGFAYTDQLDVNASVAKIVLSGKANLNSKDVDLIMYVTPKMGGTIPLVATLATGGNPIVGAGLWVADKLSGSKITDIGMGRHRYRVTGSWENPRIQEMN